MKKIISKTVMLFTLSVALISTSCQKSNISVSNEKYQQEMRRNSLEIENSGISAKYVNENGIEAPKDLSVSTDNTVASSVVLATAVALTLKSIAINNSKSVTAKNRVNQSNIQQKKISKFEVLKSIAKSRSSLNSNLKIGIVLLLVGILLSAVLGGPLAFVGGIVALIGVIFIIIGLLEIL